MIITPDLIGKKVRFIHSRGPFDGHKGDCGTVCNITQDLVYVSKEGGGLAVMLKNLFLEICKEVIDGDDPKTRSTGE
jgi:RNase P/RNase MRP subunit p29